MGSPPPLFIRNWKFLKNFREVQYSAYKSCFVRECSSFYRDISVKPMFL